MGKTKIWTAEKIRSVRSAMIEWETAAKEYNKARIAVRRWWKGKTINDKFKFSSAYLKHSKIMDDTEKILHAAQKKLEQHGCRSYSDARLKLNRAIKSMRKS